MKQSTIDTISQGRHYEILEYLLKNISRCDLEAIKPLYFPISIFKNDLRQASSTTEIRTVLRTIKKILIKKASHKCMSEHERNEVRLIKKDLTSLYFLIVKQLGDRYTYLGKERGIKREFEGDFDQMLIIYHMYVDDTSETVRDKIGRLKADAIYETYKTITRKKANKDFPIEFLEVSKAVFRKNFHDVLITVSLRKDIKELKEKMTEVREV